MSKPKRRPWRVQSDDDGAFDELVVTGLRGGSLHVEMMTRGVACVTVYGPRCTLTMSVDVDTGRVVIQEERGVKR